MNIEDVFERYSDGNDLKTFNKTELRCIMKCIKSDFKDAKSMLELPLKDYEYDFWSSEVNEFTDQIEKIHKLLH